MPERDFSRRQVLMAAAAAPFLGAAANAITPASAPSSRVSSPAAADFVQRGKAGSSRFALTFHGAGDPGLATEVLAIAKQWRAHLTIFAVGTWVAANPQLVKAFAADHHEMANHTQTHPALRRLDRHGVAGEISGCAAALSAAIGNGGAWFRPSGTPTPTVMMREEARKAGYHTVVGYDVDPRDYQDPGPSTVVARTLRAMSDGSIISLHLGHRGTVDALEPIILGARSRHLEPVTVSALLSSN